VPLQVNGSDRLIEGMEKIAVNRERVLSTMISKSVPRADQAAIAAKSTSTCNTFRCFKRYPDALCWFDEVANFLEAHAPIQRYRRHPALGDGFGRR